MLKYKSKKIKELQNNCILSFKKSLKVSSNRRKLYILKPTRERSLVGIKEGLTNTEYPTSHLQLSSIHEMHL